MAANERRRETLKECSGCTRGTKYSCIKCKIPICNLCCEPEVDEEVDGWISGKFVGYCYPCSRKVSLKRKFEDKTHEQRSDGGETSEGEVNEVKEYETQGEEIQNAENES